MRRLFAAAIAGATLQRLATGGPTQVSVAAGLNEKIAYDPDFVDTFTINPPGRRTGRLDILAAAARRLHDHRG